jgi:lauroyl/myristoyl acyltransferase
MTARLAHPSEIARLLVVAILNCASRFVPLRADEALAGAVVAPMMLAMSGRVRRSRRRLRDLLGASLSGEQLELVLRDHYRMRAEASWARIRLIHGEKWSAQIALHGVEHLERARQRGKGAIVWRMGFCDALIGHAACSRAGFPLTHLSTFHHGAKTDTRLALNVLAPIYCKSEERMLKERVMIGRSRTLGYLRTLANRIASNEVVSIAGENFGEQAVDTRFLGRGLALAPGAPALAWQTGATLLIMHARWVAPTRYEVFISEPIAVDRQRPRREWVESAVAEFVRRLEREVSAHPSGWLGWASDRHPIWRQNP